MTSCCKVNMDMPGRWVMETGGPGRRQQVLVPGPWEAGVSDGRRCTEGDSGHEEESGVQGHLT